MTAFEIEIAQFLHTVAERARNLADRCAERERDNTIDTVTIDRVASSSRWAFLMLTGKDPSEVQIHELNTENPAEWIKAHKPYSGER